MYDMAMSTLPSRREIPVYLRHRAYQAAYHNGFLWGIGHGLINSMMIRYLLIDICKTRPEGFALEGMTIAWVIAAPRLFGFLRIFATWLVDRSGSRKWFCVTGLLIAPVVVAQIPLLVPRLAAEIESLKLVLTTVVAIWCLYHLVEYFAMVAFWSWVADLVPSRIRGRFFAYREAWLITGTLIGVFLSSQLLPWLFPVAKDAPVWDRYLAPAMLGGLFNLLSALPLIRMPEVAWQRTQLQWVGRFRQMFAPLGNRRFMLLIIFVCWVNMANGLTQTSQTGYNYRLFPGEQCSIVVLFGALTSTGQLFLSPTTGRLLDRFGNAKIIAASMVLVSTGSLCYFAATPETRYFLAVAALAWVFWVGVNVGTLNMAAGLAPPNEKTAYLAFYFAMITAAMALATLAGGVVADYFREMKFAVPVIDSVWDYPQLGFVLSWFLRLISVVWLLPFLLQKELRKHKEPEV